MPTSLVSTGVQFPDSTIQTTAATASSPPGMVLVQTVNATAAATLSGTFSSTYDNYFITVNNISPSGSNAELQIRFAVGGTLQTSGYWDGFGLASNDPFTANFQSSRSTIRFMSDVSQNNPERGGNAFFYFRNVNGTTLKSFNGMANYYGNGNNGLQYYGATIGGIGINGSTAALSGFSLYWNGGQNFQATGVMRIYGLRNS